MGQRTFPFLAVLFFFTVTLCFVGVQNANATHIRAGEITVTRKNCSSLDFIITITVYTNQGSPIRFSSGGSGELNFGDGSEIHHPPGIENSPVPGFGPEFGYVVYSVEHTFPGAGIYAISYFEHNRNAGILNFFNSVETPFYLKTQISIDLLLGCDSSPRLLAPPIDKACTGSAWFHNPGAYDPDGDSLSYEMTIPKQDVGRDVNNYRDPNVQEFYTQAGISYGTANENHDGPPVFAIDPLTGTLIWDAPGPAGEYNIAFIIKEWRKTSGGWVLLGYVTRDMQIIVEDCLNKRPALTVPADICVEAGTIINQNIFGTDPDYDSVRIQAYSQVFGITNSPATFTPSSTVLQQTSPSVDAVATFTWSTTCELVKEQPYQIVFKISDDPLPGKGTTLVQFKTWNVKVVGPAPILKTATINPGQRSANLKWKKYACGNADKIQIWRKTDSSPTTVPQCVTGMPESLGYTMIGVVSGQDSTYIDNNAGIGLAQGALYCYRLVAAYPLPAGGFSRVSQEICLPPILADAPIVTNVTVDKTDPANGQITVRWRAPFEVSSIQFPPPYQYEVYRAEGLSGNTKIVSAFSGKRPDTVWIDTGLNTKETTFNYRIVAYDANAVLVDTSSTASSVRLELTSQPIGIELNWNAQVPWSNRTTTYPFHTIYRGPATSTQLSDMQLIDTVDVNEHHLHYIDSGQWNNTPLDKMLTYCYCVRTLGSYGNASIKGPLVNYSQIICARPDEITGDLYSFQSNVYVYPNPSHDYIIIKGTTQEVGNSLVIDLLGRSTPVELEKEQDWLKADISSLSDGMYILRLSEGNAVHQIKFIKQ